MTKKSFFERLVGAAEEAKKTEYEDKLTPLKKTDFEEPKKTFSKSKNNKQNLKPTEEKTKVEPTPEELPSDEEGQLTIDVYQTDSDIVIKSTIAGVKPEDIDISITNNMVTIKGRRIKDEKVSTENYYYQELYWGSFSRSVILPIDIDTDRAKASMKDGILTIRLPKTEKLKTKTIKVRQVE
mgnify:FL=1